ncbi:MAG: hypothetical protein WBK28_01245 [Minisyncoccia bacterium]
MAKRYTRRPLYEPSLNKEPLRAREVLFICVLIGACLGIGAFYVAPIADFVDDLWFEGRMLVQQLLELIPKTHP